MTFTEDSLAASHALKSWGVTSTTHPQRFWGNAFGLCCPTVAWGEAGRFHWLQAKLLTALPMAGPSCQSCCKTRKSSSLRVYCPCVSPPKSPSKWQSWSSSAVCRDITTISEDSGAKDPQVAGRDFVFPFSHVAASSLPDPASSDTNWESKRPGKAPESPSPSYSGCLQSALQCRSGACVPRCQPQTLGC